MRRLLGVLMAGLLSLGVLKAKVYEVSIHEIQYTEDPSGDSPYKDEEVITSGIVTGVFGNNFFMEEKEGGPWSGIFVYRGSGSTPSVSVGDSVVVYGIVKEYYNNTEIYARGSDYYVQIVGTTEPPEALYLHTGDVSQEMYEGVLVYVDTATCTNPNLGYGEWEVDDGTGPIRIDDMEVHYTPTQGVQYKITGPVYYSYGHYKIEPRTMDDIVPYENTPPAISWIFQLPRQPRVLEKILVMSFITDNVSVDLDSLYYRVKSAEKTVPSEFIAIGHDSLKADTFFFSIPGQSEYDTVEYFLVAIDNTSLKSVSETTSFVVRDLPPLRIEEVFYDSRSGQGQEPYVEWIEIRNTGNYPIDISGYILTDDPDTSGGNEGKFVFPEGTTIGPDEYIVVADNEDTVRAYFTIPEDVQVFNGFTGYLGNGGDDIHLFNPEGVLVDEMWYGSGGDYYLGIRSAPDVPAGHSLTRIPDSVDTDYPSKDFIDAPNPTPGLPYTPPIPCGDVNGDQIVNFDDVHFLASYLYEHGAEPIGPADVNNDGDTNDLDLVRLIRYLFFGDVELNCGGK